MNKSPVTSSVTVIGVIGLGYLRLLHGLGEDDR